MKRILSYNDAVRGELEDFLRLKRAEAVPANSWKVDLLDRLLPFATTGKLLRGSLVCFSYEAFSGRPPDAQVIRVAMAVELAHSALLIHDDIMDEDSLRRGKPSFHAQYESLAIEEKLAQAGHFGTSMAMCVGDAALFLAFESLAGCPAAVQELFTDRLVTTCGGQMQDLYLEARSEAPSKETLMELMKTKTASYTLALPMELGATLAGQPASVLERLRSIGINAGVIFQIRDDELGVMGDTRETGKPVGSDITEGKKTLLYYYLLERSGTDEREKIRSIFGNPKSGTGDIGYIQELVRSYHIAESLNDEISRLETLALADIDALAAASKIKKELTELVRFCGNRRS